MYYSDDNNDSKKITLNPRTLEKLYDDYNSFYPKNNKQLCSFSGFIKKIIVNYNNQYKILTKKLSLELDKIIKQEMYFDISEINDKNIDTINYKLFKLINSQNTTLSSDIKSKLTFTKKTINYKIGNSKDDKELEGILNSVKNIKVSESEYLRNILYAYIDQPRDKREQIVFKDIVDKINEAISTNKKIWIKTKNSRINISPWSIESSKGEIFSYLLFQKNNDNGNFAKSIHIFNILNVEILSENREFDENVLEIFDHMVENGPQFSYSVNNIKESEYTIKFKTVENINGFDVFEKRYFDRPKEKPLDEEKGIYLFNCSEFQFNTYFYHFIFCGLIEVLGPENKIQEIKKQINALNKTYL